MKQHWKISKENAGERLDIFLSAQLPDMTRSHIAKLLRQGAGTVNEAIASTHRFLKAGDAIVFEDTPPTRPRKTYAAGTAPKLDIIDETAGYLVINKPAGLLVHPDSKEKDGTLIDALIAHDPAIAKLGEDPERPGIVHRLDREVSGLMIIPRTQDAFDNLKHQFAQHSVEKRYLALVYGEVGPDEGDIKFRIARSKSKQRMAARPEGETEGKAAWTHYKTARRFHNATLLELTILSGRTHQIRAHLLALNHPIIGDPLYKRPHEDRKIKAPRLMLQSTYLEFTDPETGERKTYTLKPIPEFDALIAELKLSPTTL